MALRRTRDQHRDGYDEPELVASAVVDVTTADDLAYFQSVVKHQQTRNAKPWRWYDELGEVHYALSRGARIAGYARLGAYQLDANGNPGKQLTGDKIEARIARRLSSPYGGTRALLERYFTLMKVPAECWLVRLRVGDEIVGYDFVGAEEWDLSSVEQAVRAKALKPNAKVRRITMPAAKNGGGTAMSIEIEARDILGRIWRPSARWIDMADSSLLSNETNCDLLSLLTKGLRAKLLNRLIANGIWYVPSELNDIRTATPTGEGEERKLSSNKVVDKLLKGAIHGITNPGDPTAALPNFVVGPAQYSDNLKHITADLQLYEVEMRLRQELIDRILMGLDVQPQDVKGMGDSNHWCVDEKTTVLSRRGWVGVDELKVGDEVLALNHATGSSTWSAVTDMYVAAVEDEPMRSLQSRTHSSVTTLHHRWPTFTRYGVRRWVTTSELNSNDFITIGAPCSDVPVIPKYSDALVELAAWFWTEGNIGTSVSIAQSHSANPHKVARLRQALIAEFGVDGFAEAIQSNDGSFGGPVTIFRLRKWAGDVLTSVAPGKRVTNEFIDSLTLAQLHLFIDVSCMGDGHHWKTGQRDIWQRHPEALDAYERACILVGYGVSRVPAHDNGTAVRALKASSVRPVKAAQQAESSGNASGAIDEVVRYTGRVWCPTVATHSTYLARRDGRVFYTGNSAWAVSDDERRVNVQPEIETMCWALTEMVLRAEMREAGVPAGRISNTVIWYDMTRANVKTNLAEDARQASDRGQISDSGARLLTGIDEALAPSEDEIIRWVGRQIRDPYLATFGLKKASEIDWDKVGAGGGNGPQANSPGDKPKAGPSNDSGAPGKTESNTPRKLRPA